MMIGLIFLGFVPLMVVGAILNGYALSITWGWFMVPTFGLPELGIAQAIGIALVVGFLTKHVPFSDMEKAKEPIQRLTNSVVHTLLRPLLVLGMGWVILQFM